MKAGFTPDHAGRAKSHAVIVLGRDQICCEVSLHYQTLELEHSIIIMSSCLSSLRARLVFSVGVGLGHWEIEPPEASQSARLPDHTSRSPKT